ncbi:MAG: CoB--CoM heterodisulfide reductase iron-sulfur subunit A family protein [Methanomicrobiales archaeon]|jgi:heterodisulfide reductase subunit A|nr:CoB--CoM heterodisulfide reductase iron-sulfur subunit A family protein [Methanomicrobiales archaeon]
MNNTTTVGHAPHTKDCNACTSCGCGCRPVHEVVVLGGGVSGITAALDLAKHGVLVHLIEREPSIGGHMAMLDKTFPTNDCSMCILSPKMVEAERHPLIKLHTCTELVGVTRDDNAEEQKGRFRVELLRHPRYVNESECTGCGECTEICPIEVYNQFDAGVGVRKAIYKPHSQVVPNVSIRDSEHCIDCRLCYEICGKHAVLEDSEDKEETITLDVAAIIVAVGYETFDPRKLAQYHYLFAPDVVTSLEFERMVHAQGPTLGSLRRLSNGEKPKEIAFIQCVGSRNTAVDRPYCSCVCCMYAIKNAMLIKEKSPEIVVRILYMDVRAYGKGYDEYYERAIKQGVEFIRGLPGEIYPEGGSVVLHLENTENGEMLRLTPDLVILSVGMQPIERQEQIAGILGLDLSESGFFASSSEDMTVAKTGIPGIYLAGTCHAPRDIPDAVAAGGAAAMNAFVDLMREDCASVPQEGAMQE